MIDITSMLVLTSYDTISLSRSLKANTRGLLGVVYRSMAYWLRLIVRLPKSTSFFDLAALMNRMRRAMDEDVSIDFG